MQVGLKEGYVVVATIPKYDIGFPLCRVKDLFVVHPCVNGVPLLDVLLVFLNFLNRAFMLRQVFDSSEPLAALSLQISIRHRMADNNHRLVSFLK